MDLCRKLNGTSKKAIAKGFTLGDEYIGGSCVVSVTYSDVESKLRDTLRYEEIVRQSSPHFHDTDNSSINL